MVAVVLGVGDCDLIGTRDIGVGDCDLIADSGIKDIADVLKIWGGLTVI